MHWRFVPMVLVLLAGCAAGLFAADGDPVTVAETATETETETAAATRFRERVEPILRKRCYSCHSHEAKHLKAGLTLDWKEGWLAGGSRGPAIEPGSPDKSLLIRAVRREDESLQMPPAAALPADELAVLVEWVAEGAVDPRVRKPDPVASSAPTDWWSLKPLVAPSVPGGSASNPVDRFVDARLAKAGLTRSPQAERRDLIRRLTYDLHGLPPTPEEVAAFVADSSPTAYEALVDKLLASPRYGERWARHWLDAVHFADTHGFEHDIARDHAWRYRDWVIAAFNDDLPWDRSIREQLAADWFFPDEPSRMAALGFLGAGPFDYSTYATATITYDYLERDDLVTQTMSAFASTTANCARCHDHKFDPVSQFDYYALQAVFAGVQRGNLAYDADLDTHRTRTKWLHLAAAADSKNAEILLTEEYSAQVAAWSRDRKPVEWQPLEVQTFVSTDGATLTRQADGSYLASGTRPDRDSYVLSATSPLPIVTAVRLEVLPHDSLPMRGPGRQDNGNLHLSELEMRVFGAGATTGTPVKFRRARADFDQQGWGIERAIDGDPQTAWGIHPAVGQPHEAVFEPVEPLRLESGARVTVSLRQLHGAGHLIGAFRLAVTSESADSALPLPEDVRQALAVPVASRDKQQQTAIAAHVLAGLTREKLAQLPPKVLVYAAGSTVEVVNAAATPLLATRAGPKVIHRLHRGDFDKPREVSEVGAIAALTHAPARFELKDPLDERARRAALADWLAHPQNPLTWRSAVNRVWQHHFGRGICDTPSDFGRMGGIPTHPELLDWLAVHFRDDCQMRLKPLHRLIVTSETYRQASATRTREAEIDGENRLLWRQQRSRLDADSYRDFTLAVAGTLDTTMGGPGVRYFSTSPGQQLTPALNYSGFDWNGPGTGRRSIYRFVWRGISDPLLDALDFPDLGLLSPVRGFSASSLQALTLFNSEFTLAHCEKLAARLEREAETTEARVERAVSLVWLRVPTDSERTALVTFTNEQGLPALARLLLNSNEFLFLD